jgi:hypothetical protein
VRKRKMKVKNLMNKKSISERVESEGVAVLNDREARQMLSDLFSRNHNK